LSDTRGRHAQTFSGNAPKNACLAMSSMEVECVHRQICSTFGE
jgi:hypothetical protein